MFTGIVKGLCEVIKVVEVEGLTTITIDLGTGDISTNLETGASIAINGACLTVVRFYNTEKGTMACDFDCMKETLDRTNLSQCKIGSRVNVERAMKLGDEFGGHQVSGHVDCVGKIEKIEKTPNNVQIFFSFPKSEYRSYLVEKGWICIDGVSLTVVHVEDQQFSVCLIPETLQRTTLGFREVGDSINLEFDSQTKIVVQTIERLLPGILKAQLK